MSRKLSEELEGYRSWLELSRSKHTVKAYSVEAERFMSFVDKPLSKISTIDVTRYLGSLEKDGYKRTSMYRIAVGLKRFFRVCGRPDLADSMPMPKYESKFNPPWLSYNQINTLFKSAKPGLSRTMLMIWYELALREGEVPLLKISWLDRSNGNIKVKRLKRKGFSEDVISIRKKAFYGNPLEELIKYLDERDDDLDSMFTVKYGGEVKPIAQRTVSYHYRQAALSAKINPDVYRPHTLRHSRLTHMAIEMIKEHGVADLAKIAKFGGHVNISTTLKYVHLAGEWLQTQVK